ncbi:hypothetical protein NMY22_g11097 [Coprinellus aureogranulatus]|nr:hypothetical protein NMY22_g11097 [Coprinellus aureogranulatus]
MVYKSLSADARVGPTLAQQLAELQDPAPVGEGSFLRMLSSPRTHASLDFDPESLDDQEDDGGPQKVGSSAAQEHYVEVGPSSLRTLTDSVSDPKYDGVRTSRQELLEEDETSDEAEEEGSPQVARDDDEGSEGEFEGFGAEGPWSASEEEGGGGDESEGSQDAQRAIVHPMAQRSPPPAPPNRRSPKPDQADGDLATALKASREADRRKGKAVSKQIALWDGLLDSRIRLQKAVVAANRLPEPSRMGLYQEDEGCTEALLKLSEEALGLVGDLCELQRRLFSTTGTSPPPKKRRKLDSEVSIPSVLHDLEEASKEAADFEQAYHSHLVPTLSKWSTKIQAVAPSVLLPSNKGTFSKGKQAPKSAVQLVDETLLDHAHLLSRTQLRRAPGSRVGKVPVEDSQETKEDVEVFDDTDFYQKMLRAIMILGVKGRERTIGDSYPKSKRRPKECRY